MIFHFFLGIILLGLLILILIFWPQHSGVPMIHNESKYRTEELNNHIPPPSFMSWNFERTRSCSNCNAIGRTIDIEASLFSNECSVCAEPKLDVEKLRKWDGNSWNTKDEHKKKNGINIKIKSDFLSSDSEIRRGLVCLKGTRFGIGQVLAELGDGKSLSEVCDNYDLDENDVSRALDDLARSLGHY